MTKARQLFTVLAAFALLSAGPVGCSAPQQDEPAGVTESGIKVGETTSAADFGGMDGLVAAAKKEGELNVIALAPDWANYGAIIKAFSDRYGIKVDSAQPDAAGQEEINAANQQRGEKTAPDVFDLGQSVALANRLMFAPYQVVTFNDIPPALKDPGGVWVNDYSGYMSIGYDSAKVPGIGTVADLLKPAYRGKVALNGDPTQSGAAFSGVAMAAVAQGGSVDDIAAGVDFFHRLKQAGNFVPVDPSAATIASGQTPVVIDWDYRNAAERKKLPSWKVVVPPGPAVAGYYFQAVNKGAPHPAAARLWQEFLFSDEGQNLYLASGARPVRTEAMRRAGTLDMAAYRALPPAPARSVTLSPEQTRKAADYLAANWARATG